jgi:cyclopropane fatty-acyl-phospholipid synthase-like methyltransferase
MFVLDLGCGLGGASRYLSAECGCRVAAIDTTPGHRKRRAIPRFRRVQLHDRRGAGDRWRNDGRRETSAELKLIA